MVQAAPPLGAGSARAALVETLVAAACSHPMAQAAEVAGVVVVVAWTVLGGTVLEVKAVD